MLEKRDTQLYSGGASSIGKKWVLYRPTAHKYWRMGTMKPSAFWVEAIICELLSDRVVCFLVFLLYSRPRVRVTTTYSTRRYFQHAHFIPTVGVGKRSGYSLVHGDLPRQHSLLAPCQRALSSKRHRYAIAWPDKLGTDPMAYGRFT